MTLYPLIFKPIFKELIWGGADILPFKGFDKDDARKIGESWEISHVSDNFSVVANGSLEGQTIDDLIHTFGARLLGKKVLNQSGLIFPLLIKFIDARDNLSVQVHPNDKLARKRHNSFGKTEMWYVVNAAPDAVLYSGFSHPVTAEEYVQRVENDTLMEVLNKYKVKTGDVFFLPAGRVHAIGAGCFIAEIQQTSDITYRIYDYNRKDAAGNTRELHTDSAVEAIDYSCYPDCQTHYTSAVNEAVLLASCKYFTTNLLDRNKPLRRNLSDLDSFVIYICTRGSALIKDNNGFEIAVNQGYTALIPAEISEITITPSDQAVLLETYIF